MDMQTGWNENRALLRGVAAAPPVFSHANHGVSYETFPLSVLRLSGQRDTVNVVASRELLAECPAEEGKELEVEGEVRSFNNKSGHGSRLVITLYARALRPGDGEPVNDLTLAGVLCKPPVLRRTPLGRDICDLMLAVNRRYGRADYLPWHRLGHPGPAMRRAGGGRRGAHRRGRLQSRGYTKVENGVSYEKTAYEVSVMQLEAVEDA